MASSPSLLCASGGVIWRVADGVTEVLLIHRPKPDDWSFPKGKPNKGEHRLQTAIREVTEETGLEFVVGARLGSVQYPVGSRMKSVAYWSMRVVDPMSTPVAENSGEVDDFVWLPVQQALERLTYVDDQRVLRTFQRRGRGEVSLVLVRHGRAGKRSEWNGDDLARPLDAVGRRQAAAIGQTLTSFAPTELMTAKPLRCAQTLAPLAARSGLPVVVMPSLGDLEYAKRQDAAKQEIAQLLKHGRRVVASSQGDVIEATLQTAIPGRSNLSSKKGGVWVFTASSGSPLTADYYPTLLGVS